MKLVRRGLLFVGLGLSALLLIFALVLVEAHLEMQRLEPVLPQIAEMRALADPPAPSETVRVRYLNTATQAGGAMPIAHSVFLLEWPDGRLLAVDVGMEPEQARRFGRPMEILLGADPTTPHGSLATQLGVAVQRIDAVVFTHLHLDHTGGLPGLCKAKAAPLVVFQTRRQAERGNFGTSLSDDDLAGARCAQFRTLEPAADGALLAVPGFAGLYAIQASGHTPGSTLYAVRTAEGLLILAGDVTNTLPNLTHNIPKPLPYSLFIVPEARGHLERLRLWLGELAQESRISIVVSHDLAAIASRLDAW